MFVDYVLNGAAHGPVGQQLAGVHFDPGYMRPFLVTHNGRNIPCVTITTGRNDDGTPQLSTVPIMKLQERGINNPVWNATSLRKEEWLLYDTKLVEAARFRLRAWGDLVAQGLTFGGFNGMSKLLLEHETMSDPGEAVVDFSGLTPGRGDSPQFQLEGLPLPITHSDFYLDSRRLAASRNSGTPLDMTMGKASARRVAEKVEKILIGSETGVTYGGNSTQVGGYGRTSSVYGYKNFTKRITSTALYKPNGVGRSGTGWVPNDTVKDVLALLDVLRLNKFYGPFMVYTSNDWDQYMDADYLLTGGNVTTMTLRERLRKIDGIVDVRRLDFLTAAATAAGDPADVKTTNPFTLVFVQMTEDVVRAVTGMDITTVQWEEKGGMKLCFKVMCIMVPQLRCDFYGNCGILDAVASLG